MPSSGIVIVENSGNADTHNIIQTQHQPQQQHHQQQQLVQHHIQTQQVIVNDEFINAENLVASGGGHYITNEILSNAQIIKFVSEEEAALIEQQQQLQDEQLYTTITTQQHQSHQHQSHVQNISNPNSKVHVISNVTIVSKAQHQPQPHTISFVNSKHIPSSGNMVNATYISTKQSTTLPQTGKIVNIPYKGINQQQQHHHTTATTTKTVQKVTVPRIVTRVQTVPQQSNVNATIISRSNNTIGSNIVGGNAAGGAPPINSVIQTHQVQKQHTIQTVPAQSIGKLNNVRTANRTNAVASTIKVMHGNNTGSTIQKNTGLTIGGVGAIKTNLPQQQQQPIPKNHTKSSKIIKHYNNSQPSSAIYTPQQQQQQNKNIHVQQISINNNNNNHINTTNKTIQRPASNINNIYIHGPIQRMNKNNKYTVQQHNQVSQMVLSSNQTQQQNQIQQPQQLQQHIKLSNSHQYQQMQTNIGSSGAGGTTIKYVNAQGNVMSSQNTRVRTILQQSVSPLQQQQILSPQQQTLFTSSDVSQNTTNESLISPGTSVNSIDDIVMVNGTHMSEEMSARILQSLSQKSVYNNSNNNNNTSNSINNNNRQNHYIKHPVQQQQQQTGLNTNDYAPQQPNVQQNIHTANQQIQQKSSDSGLSDQATNKSGPEYFKVKYVYIYSIYI